jgi:hypothetical protein
MNILYDSLDIDYKQCGCAISSNLDIIENLITENVIILCKKHFIKSKNKKDYVYNKNKSTYMLNSFLLKSSIKNNITNNIKKSSSFINLTENNNKSDVILFGKYKYKTFKYVYNNDKLYCYNLSIWNDKIYNNNQNMLDFIDFIKESIKIY